MDLTNIAQATVLLIAAFALKVLGAIAVWLVARRVIAYIARLVVRSLKYPFDQTVAGYIGTAVAVLLNIGMILGILGLFGIETTSFAALLAGGIIGTVQEIGLFVTTIDMMDNVRTFVGNNKILSDNIQNFTANPYRRVDLVAQLHNVVDPQAAVRLLKAQLARIPNVLTQPAPDVEIVSFNPLGPVLAVRPYCHTDHYWQVYFDTNRAIRESFGEAGFPAPEQNVFVPSAG